MPKLPNKEIAAEHEDGSKYHSVVECSVGEDGTFSISIPEDLLDIAVKRSRIGNAWVGQARSNCPYRIYSKSLGEGLNYLKTCAEEHLAAETITERVIVYRTRMLVSAWLGSDGKLYPNGSFDERDKGKWWRPKAQEGSIDATHTTPEFSVGVGAKVFDKITTKRASGDKVRYEEISAFGNTSDQDEELRLLNGFTCLRFKPKDWGRTGEEKEMPYTREAARFFVNIMLGMAQLAINIDAFFADKERLALAIQGGQNLLGFNTNERTETSKS